MPCVARQCCLQQRSRALATAEGLRGTAPFSGASHPQFLAELLWRSVVHDVSQHRVRELQDAL